MESPLPSIMYNITKADSSNLKKQVAIDMAPGKCNLRYFTKKKNYDNFVNARLKCRGHFNLPVSNRLSII